MSDDFKREAKRQYLHYFRFWFIGVGILFVITVAAGISYYLRSNAPRGNSGAPEERVYDYADMLTDEEEEKLRRYIAKQEKKYRTDFVIMTFNQPVEGEEAQKRYGYDSAEWEHNMMDIADNFWDENGYGYNTDYEGDGSILIDNRYEGQRGEWLSTSGKVERRLDTRAVENVLYAVDDYYDTDPYKAYKAYIDKVCGYLGGDSFFAGISYWIGAGVISVLITAVYVSSNLKRNKVRDDVAVNAYVSGGRPLMRNKGDDFIRKSVVQRRIETNQSSGGGSRSGGGGGGHHTSHSGASHGGGGHRH